MIIARLDPDKVLIHDPLSDKPVHTIELSDERSVGHFITFWVKGNEFLPPVPEGVSEFEAHHHNAEEMHRDQPDHGGSIVLAKVLATYSQIPGWKAHYHVPLSDYPTLDDLEGHPVPDSIKEAARSVLLDGWMRTESWRWLARGMGGLNGMFAEAKRRFGPCPKSERSRLEANFESLRSIVSQ